MNVTISGTLFVTSAAFCSKLTCTDRHSIWHLLTFLLVVNLLLWQSSFLLLIQDNFIITARSLTEDVSLLFFLLILLPIFHFILNLEYQGTYSYFLKDLFISEAFIYQSIIYLSIIYLNPQPSSLQREGKRCPNVQTSKCSQQPMLNQVKTMSQNLLLDSEVAGLEAQQLESKHVL